jgi:hypothetical protein
MEKIMRHLFLASTAAALFCGGLALANPHGGSTTTTVTAIPVVGNAGAGLGSSAAASGGTSTNASGNTVASGNTSTPTDKNAVSESDSASATTGGSSQNDSANTLVSVGDVSLSSVTTHEHLDVTFANSGNSGSVGSLTITGDGGREGREGGGAAVMSGNASISNSVNGSTGITTAQQNAGTASLQQNSVALGSYVGSGTGFNGF